MPSLRIEQSDLKCKNGCDYFGNPQWQGYCSKCHREQMQKQRKAEKASSTSATLPRPDQRRPDRGLKPATHSSFSKFEEKRLRQSETLKKTNLLKFNTLFKKSHTVEEHDHQVEKRPGFKIPSQVNDNMKMDFRIRFPKLPPTMDRDARLFVHSFIMDVIKCHSVMSVDELSERVQRQYQRFMKHMDTSPHFADVDSETKERLMDFVEKHAMTYLHEMPSIVFSPSGTDDERLDRAMSERIQQLSWVCERHLECKLDRASPDCRRLLYKAISELLGMDSAPSPGGKLARVRRCCRYVLQLCGCAPASADDLLPALIFTVLKANPPRLTSNINFVTRFCNAQRLMTGEGGYYFTNLCCAVSFIENLNAESLNMDKKEFDCYMAMPASIGGSSWAAALSLCGAAREAAEQREHIRQLREQAEQVREQADLLAANADTFEEQISKKVEDLLSKTPLEILPRRELPRIGKLKEIHSEPLIDLDTQETKRQQETKEPQETVEPPQQTGEIPQQTGGTLQQTGKIPQQTSGTLQQTGGMPQQTGEILQQTGEMPQQTGLIPQQTGEIPQKTLGIPQIQRETPKGTEEHESKLNILGFEVIERESPQNLDHWELKQTNSLELLTPSPLGFTPFDSRSIDELMTPEDFVTDHLAPGLGNINYDIDLSDFSGDNSIAEDAPKPQDPFSPDGLKKAFDPFAPQTSKEQCSKLEKFDEFSLIDTRTKSEEPFAIVHRNGDPFSPDSIKKEFDPFAPQGQCVPDPLTPQRQCGPDPFTAQGQCGPDPFTPQGQCVPDPFTPQGQCGPDPFTPQGQCGPDPFASEKDTSILDAGDSPTGVCMLPSPLQPQTTGKNT